MELNELLYSNEKHIKITNKLVFPLAQIKQCNRYSLKNSHKTQRLKLEIKYMVCPRLIK